MIVPWPSQSTIKLTRGLGMLQISRVSGRLGDGGVEAPPDPNFAPHACFLRRFFRSNIVCFH